MDAFVFRSSALLVALEAPLLLATTREARHQYVKCDAPSARREPSPFDCSPVACIFEAPPRRRRAWPSSGKVAKGALPHSRRGARAACKELNGELDGGSARAADIAITSVLVRMGAVGPVHPHAEWRWPGGEQGKLSACR